ncbi:hypothetical protein OKN36_04340 [Furfurilactobacillus sp. OKN36]
MGPLYELQWSQLLGNWVLTAVTRNLNTSGITMFVRSRIGDNWWRIANQCGDNMYSLAALMGSQLMTLFIPDKILYY